MKVCKRCGEVINDEGLTCKNPNCYGRDFEDYNQSKNKANNKLIAKENLKRTICYSIIFIYSLIIALLLIINGFKGVLTLALILETIVLMIVTVLCLRFTGKVFLITHIFSLNNIDENNMSDMYDTYVKILGICSAIYSIIVLIKL